MRLSRSLPCLALTVLVLLTGCESNPTPAVDTRIKLATSPDGKTVALPPECGQWQHGFGEPWQNEPWPNYGCAQAHNLAVTVERPEDLIAPIPSAVSDGVTAASSVDRYRAGKTVPLIDAKSDAPVTIVVPTTAGSPK